METAKKARLPDRSAKLAVGFARSQALQQGWRPDGELAGIGFCAGGA